MKTFTKEDGSVLAVEQVVTCGDGVHKMTGKIADAGFIGFCAVAPGCTKCWFLPSNGGQPFQVYAEDCEAV